MRNHRVIGRNASVTKHKSFTTFVLVALQVT